MQSRSSVGGPEDLLWIGGIAALQENDVLSTLYISRRAIGG